MLSVQDLVVKRGSSVALNGISFALPKGKTLAVVGESGAGKSTLVAAILGHLRPASGQITWNGSPTRHIRPALVMQEPRAAFNPARSLRQTIEEPLIAGGTSLPRPRLERLCTGLELSPEVLERRPDEVSIGQVQRAGILRALMTKSPLVLFDEPLSALDAVTQKHTARLIAELQAKEGFAALIVTHDLGYAVARADQIVVLRAGQMEAACPATEFAQTPATDYCRRLRDAAISLGGLEVLP